MDQYGNMIEASANAPKQAICPHCKAIVILRTRRRENLQAGITYFWRHQNYSSLRCPAHSWHDMFN